ncbi:MAG: M13 family metallopeptidase [Bacteroidetes bacterium]|nr:M13 family metallopeptidase [Bacteroidota bacterium]
MSPQTVNAYYNPTFNEIVFPAAILQPPFYNYTADAAVNYGGIGAVIGHEMSHGFDDQGARFDAEGNLTNWWTEEDENEFRELGKDLIAQFDSVEALPGINLNGEFTLGENIGDLGGVFSAYDALQMDLAVNGDPGAIDGFTQTQRFYLSWATIWRQLIREEALKNRIKTDPHSPGEYRGYMPIMNMDEFQAAFNIQEGDKMYLSPEQRVKIW